jgi:all-trans-retinol dehydrogenase (NAD+)
MIFCFFLGSGLGRGVAKRFASLGATVVLWDVNEKGNEETKQQILENWSHAKVHSMKVDLCDRNDIYRVAEQVRSSNFFFYFTYLFLDQVRNQVGDVTMVINNAGVVSGKSLLDLDDVSIQRTFDVNIIAHFWVIIFIKKTTKKFVFLGS